MLSLTELARTERPLRSAKALSVYLDGAVEDPAVRAAWRQELHHRLARERQALARAAHDEREALERCAAQLDRRLAGFDGALGAPGWFGFFTPEGEVHADVLPVRMPNLVAWGEGLRIGPYIRALKQLRPAIVAVVDARRARIYEYARGGVQEVETIHAHARTSPPQHMGAPPRQGFHMGTHGTAGTDAAERALRAGTQAMLRQLVARLEVLAGAESWIFVGGIPEVTAATMRLVPDRLHDRAQRIGGLDVHATRAQIAAAVEEATTEASRARDLTLVRVLLSRRAGDGRAVAGVHDTRKAVRAHTAKCLFFTGAFVHDQAPACESFLRHALEDDVELEFVSGAAADALDEVGGVGALLRFAPVARRENG